MDDEETLTTEEAGRLLGVQARTVRDYIRAGRLTAHRERRGFRTIYVLRRADVEALRREIEAGNR